MMRTITIVATILGLTSVMMGAAGDHLLEGKLTPDIAHTFDVALRYHQLYAILIFCMGIYGTRVNHEKLYAAACVSFLAGLIIFSGTLYASLWLDIPTLTFGTPVGGLLLMTGWILAGASFLKKANSV